MGLLIRAACLASACLLAGPAGAVDWQLALDARLVHSDGEQSFLNGGLGKVRFDSEHDGLRLGRVRLEAVQTLGETFDIRASASAWGDHDKTPVDITEAFLTYRPYPRSAWRGKIRAGVFYAPISLENRGAGWATPYTISSSAVNTWLAEEIRTAGVEAELDWLGSKTGSGSDFALIGAIYEWNDPAGVLVASHGFALHDRQTGLFGLVGQPGNGPVNGRHLFREIDGRPGYYLGGSWRRWDRFELRALHYDNRADDKKFDAAIGDFAWRTRFNALGARLETDSGWTLTSQWLGGTTSIQADGQRYIWRFNAKFALLSKLTGKHRLSLRHDRFNMHTLPSGLGSDDTGYAWTGAYGYMATPKLQLMLEYLRVHSDSTDRRDWLGLDPVSNENKIELSVRYTWSGSL
jgi:hypothetical protein